MASARRRDSASAASAAAPGVGGPTVMPALLLPRALARRGAVALRGGRQALPPLPPFRSLLPERKRRTKKKLQSAHPQH
ncbi:unnamed protein product, partial [Cladocopium goreaui]